MVKRTDILARLRQARDVQERMLADPGLIETLAAAADDVIASYRLDGKTLFCGNGGSAADAQHLAAELSGRFYYDRPPLFAEALHTNTSS